MMEIRDFSSLSEHPIPMITLIPQTLFQSLTMQTQMHKVLFNIPTETLSHPVPP